jgi:aminopeptidase
MTDPRIEKLAQVLVHYSMALKPAEEFCLICTPLAQELALAVYKEALLAGANIFVQNKLETDEIFYKYATDAQLDYVSPIRRIIIEQFSARLIINAPVNTRTLSNIDPERIQRAKLANKELFDTFMNRFGSGEFKWCDTVFPTPALAQEADMSLADYQDFVFQACMLDSPDPIKAWKDMKERQNELVRWLSGKDKLRLVGPNIDIRLSVLDRTFGAYNGQYNFPDGEIATSPVESSINGWVRFSYPAIYAGQEVIDVELWFKEGKIVKEKASKGQSLLTTTLNTDAGSRYIGELGIGTNYNIDRFTKNMLFDEKMGGTIHLAAGASLPNTGGKNKSGIHWDMLCDMSQAEMYADGELFYQYGKFVI